MLLTPVLAGLWHRSTNDKTQQTLANRTNVSFGTPEFWQGS